MRGGINGDSKQDNNLDTSDSPMFEDSEVSLNDRWSLFFWPIECNKLLSNTNLNWIDRRCCVTQVYIRSKDNSQFRQQNSFP